MNYSKIDHIIEEAILSSALMAGAAMDTYMHGNTNAEDYVKPLAAWGIGGALGAALQEKVNQSQSNPSNILKNGLTQKK